MGQRNYVLGLSVRLCLHAYLFVRPGCVILLPAAVDFEFSHDNAASVRNEKFLVIGSRWVALPCCGRWRSWRRCRSRHWRTVRCGSRSGWCLSVCVCVCVCSGYNRTPRPGRGPWTNNGTCHTYTDVKLSRPDWSWDYSFGLGLGLGLESFGLCLQARSPGARFTKYLTTILRLSYDNVKVMIDLRRMSNLQKHPTKGARFFLGTIHLQTYKIVRDSVRKLAYDIPKRNFSTF